MRTLDASWLLGFADQLTALAEPERPAIESDWRDWLTTLFAAYVSDFAPHHAEFWDWIWQLEPGVRPQPFVAIWPRGGGKSTNAELACVAVGARRARSYGLYVCATQEQADDHVANVAAMLESAQVELYYPTLASRKLGKYGNSQGWRRNRLRTASGFTLDAVGMDTAARGVKLEQDRPDFMVIDDIDEEKDSPEATEKKIRRLTRALIPAGSADVAILMIQNLVLPDGIFARIAGLSSEKTAIIAERYLSGPHPAIRDFTYEERDGRAYITGGEATWRGMDLDRCQQMINDMTISAFLVECQHEVRERGARIFLPAWWDGTNRFDPGNTTIPRLAIARYCSWDTGLKDKDDSAYTVCTVAELMPDYQLLVREVYRERLTFPSLPAKIEEIARRYNRDEKLRGIIIEDKASGTSAIQTLMAEADDWIAGLLIPFMPSGDKEQRANQAAIWCRAGMVQLPYPSEHAPWLGTFEMELFDAPQSHYMDQVDSFSQLIIYLEHYLSAGWHARGITDDAA